jgi:hypothetical protein
MKIKNFKCPFCGGRTKIDYEKQSGGFIEAWIHCLSDRPEVLCCISISFGAVPKKQKKDLTQAVKEAINKFPSYN